MAILESFKIIIKEIKGWIKSKKEEKEITYMQARGNSMLKGANWTDHPYMQRSSIGIEKSKSVLDKLNNIKKR